MTRLPAPGADDGTWGDILNDYLSQAHTSTGAIKPGAVTKSDIGLSNADNTSDANKPISGATQTALSAKLAAVDLDAQTATKINDTNSATAGAIKSKLGTPWLPNTSYVLGDVFSRPSDGAVRVVTTSYTSGATYTDANSKPAPSSRYLRSVSTTGEAKFTTTQEATASALGWAIVTDPRYAGGADPTGLTSSLAAFRACIDDCTKGPAGAEPVGLRSTVKRMWIPPGTYLLDGILEIISARSFVMQGSGARGTVLMFSGVFAADAMAFISCPNLTLADFKVSGTTDTTVADSMLAIDCIPTRGATSATRVDVQRVYVEGGGCKFKYGFGLGCKTAGNDLAQVHLQSCHSAGSRVALQSTDADGTAPDDPRYWQAGYVSGSGVGGNILNHAYTSCSTFNNRYGFIMNGLDNVSYRSCNASNVDSYLYLGTGRCITSVQNARVEGSRRFMVRPSGSSTPVILNADVIRFGSADGSVPPDREIIQWGGPGVLSLRGLRFDADDVTPSQFYKIRLNSNNALRQINCFIDGILCPNDTAESLFAVTSPTPVFAVVQGLYQYAGGAGDAGVFLGKKSLVYGVASGDIDANSVPSNNQTGISYTIAASDPGQTITMNNASANTVIIPTNAVVPLPIGAVINVEQLGVGITTIAPNTGATLRSRGGVTSLAGQYAAASVRKIDTDEWLLTGDLS